MHLIVNTTSIHQHNMSASENVKQENDKFSDGLETAEEYKQRWRSIYIIYFTMFIVSVGFTIVFTGVWPYLDKLDPTAGKTYMGYVVGACPFAQMVFAPVVGWWCNKLGSIRMPVLVTLIVFALANILYSSLELFPTGRKHWMLASRFFIGITSANMVGLRTYLSAATRFSERRKAIAMFSLAQVLGFIVGPSIQAVLVPFGNEGFWLIPNRLKLDMYTATGWFNVIIALANAYLYLPSIFKEHKIAEREAALEQGGSSSQKADSPVPKLAAWCLIIFHFIVMLNFMIMETLGSAIAMDHFAYTKAEAVTFMGILMSIGAASSCVCYVIIDPLCKKFGELNVLIWGGFFLMSVGRLFYIPISGDVPLSFDEDYRLGVLKSLDNCTSGIKADPVAWNVSEAQLKDAEYLNQLCNYTEVVGCPSSQHWCLTTSSILVWQFVLGTVLINLSFPLGLTMLHTLFSKILGVRPQGVWMGYMSGLGSFARVTGPVFMTRVYTKFGPNWTFGATAVMLFCSTIYLRVFSDHFMIAEDTPKKEEIILLEKEPILVNSVQVEEKEEDEEQGKMMKTC